MQIAVWLFWALFAFVSRLVFLRDAWLAFALTAMAEPLGFLVTSLAHLAFRKRLHDRQPLTLVGVALALSGAGGVVLMLLVNLLKQALTGAPDVRPDDLTTDGALVPAVYYTLIFFGWSLAYLWIHSDHELAAQQLRHGAATQAALRAELDRLRLQLDAHLLFNALNTVAMEIPEAPGTALEMTHRIASYLRYSLDHHDQGICRLADEIEAMQTYVRIHELRFEDCLHCAVSVTPEAQEVRVPHLVLQPLVENAVNHGATGRSARFDISISCWTSERGLHVRIANSGRLAPAGRSGVGLANVRNRLALHYPRRHEFALYQEGALVVAALTLSGAAREY